ncbi:MAG: FAH family protein, partial [Sphingopyxis sp.]
MIRSLIQFEKDGARGVAALDGDGQARALATTPNILALAHDALAAHTTLAALATQRLGDVIDMAAKTLLCPIDHADPARMMVSGTGLTHMGSAAGRDAMHKAAAAGEG